MNSPESTPDPEQHNLTAEVVALQKQVFVLLIALIVVTGTLTAFLYRQTTLISKQIDSLQAVVDNYNSHQNVYETFVNQLGQYAEAHPEFRPVLAKYGLNIGAKPPVAPRK